MLSRSQTWIYGVHCFPTLSSQEVLPCSKVGLSSRDPTGIGCPKNSTVGLFFPISFVFFFFFFLGFGDRLLSEVKKLAPKDVKIRVGWTGGWAGTAGLQGHGDVVFHSPPGNAALVPHGPS